MSINVGWGGQVSQNLIRPFHRKVKLALELGERASDTSRFTGFMDEEMKFRRGIDFLKSTN